MLVNPDFKFSLSELEPELEPQYEPEFEPDFHWSKLECSDPDIPIGMSEQEDREDVVQILEPPPIPWWILSTRMRSSHHRHCLREV
jgi:hypothetical protein